MKTYQVEFKGLTPLLMHADTVDGRERLEAWRKDPANKNKSRPGDDRSPPWTWHTYCYSDGKSLAVPSGNIMRACMDGGTKVILKKQETFKKLSQAGMLLADDNPELLVNGKPIATAPLEAMLEKPFAEQCEIAKKLGFKLDVRPVVVGKAKHIRVRPRFDNWSIRVAVNVIAEEITDTVLEQILHYSGRSGLMDWRPSSPMRPGPFGQFTAKIAK